MNLDGRVALVTGGARRLGAAFVDALVSRGMRVALHYGQSRAEADAAIARYRADAHDVAGFHADLRDAAAAAELPDRVAELFGGIDVLINSAAVMERATLENTTVELWDDVLALNLRAPFLLAQRSAKYLREAHGAIVNIADLAGLEPWPNYLAHSVSKSGVIALTRNLARALAPEVRVNAIAPGAVLIPEDYDEARRESLAASTPLRRLGSPDDAVQALLYLLEHGDFVTGETIVVDGGRLLR